MWRKLLVIGVLGACASAWSGGGPPDTSVPAVTPLSVTGAHARRIALVIGNAEYPGDRLGSPIRDATTVGRTLRSLGFEVVIHTDLDAKQMRDAIDEFGRRLAAGGTGLFYFAGHGFRVGNATLLAPVDGNAAAPLGLVGKAVDLAQVLDSMAATRAGKANLVILDTCLDNPFDPHGVAETGATLPEQTLIAYATAPGALAEEGPRFGRFTEALLRSLGAGGRDAETVLREAAAIVLARTGGKQFPQVVSTLSEPFRFARATSLGTDPPRLAVADDAAPVKTRGILPKDSADQYELTFWDSIKDSEYASDYEAYLKAYPNGRFAALARARIERLRAAEKKEKEKAAPSPAPPAQRAPAPERAKPAAPTPAPRARPSPEVAPAAAPSPAVAGLTEITDCPACPVMIALPAGRFVMGSNTDDPSERPAHSVSIGQPFAIGKYEVTTEQWAACVEAGGCPKLNSEFNSAKNAPARDLSWDDAQKFANWLSKTTGKRYRLPTEAEWEYAIRGGTSSRYWWGSQMQKGNADCRDCGERSDPDGPAPSGSFKPNPYGLHDMNGSVWEWVSDCWHSSFRGAPDDGRAWDEPDCRVRVIRGGSWRDGADYMLSSTRFKYGASVRHFQNGFRVARELK